MDCTIKVRDGLVFTGAVGGQHDRRPPTLALSLLSERRR